MNSSNLRRFLACVCFLAAILFLSSATELRGIFTTGLEVIAGFAWFAAGYRIAQTV